VPTSHDMTDSGKPGFGHSFAVSICALPVMRAPVGGAANLPMSQERPPGRPPASFELSHRDTVASVCLASIRSHIGQAPHIEQLTGI
jgi:hypothetical protein